MVDIDNISKYVISKFTKFKDEDNDFVDTAKVLYKKKLSKPDWCFVAEKDDRVYGRVGYWSAPDKKEVAHIFGFDLVLDKIKTLQIGKKLLQDSFQDMKDQGFKKIKAQTHSNDGDIYKVSNQLYQSIGMDKTQLKKRFQLNTNQYDQRKYNRLEYKSLKEIGKEKFMSVLEDVSNDSLDSSVAKRINKLGKGQAVEEHFNILKSIEYSKENWLIGIKDKKIVGLVIPQKFDQNRGAINYIGVVKEKRGYSYLIDLLDKGIKNLISRGNKKIIADIDLNNFPMENGLKKVGFKYINKIINYELTLKHYNSLSS